MGKLINVSITETGGEFTCGTIKDEDLVYYIKSTIEDGDIGSNCELENGQEFDALMYDNIFHLYAPNVRNAKVRIQEAIIQNDSDYDNPDKLVFSEVFYGSIDKSGIKLFTSFCPGEPELKDGDLSIYTKKYEKRITGEYFIKIKDGETFDPQNIYLGFVLLDEVMDYVEDEILKYFFYIPKEAFKAYLSTALKNMGEEEFDENNLEEEYDFEESMQEILWLDSQINEKIKKNNKIDCFSCEGKGEWENDYLKFTDSDGEVLYEEGWY